MLGKEDLEDPDEYQDVVDDIKSEVSKFGNLVSLMVPRVGERGEGKVRSRLGRAALCATARVRHAAAATTGVLGVLRPRRGGGRRAGADWPQVWRAHRDYAVLGRGQVHAARAGLRAARAWRCV